LFGIVGSGCENNAKAAARSCPTYQKDTKPTATASRSFVSYSQPYMRAYEDVNS